VRAERIHRTTGRFELRMVKSTLREAVKMSADLAEIASFVAECVILYPDISRGEIFPAILRRFQLE
jgi:hypothetical protein